MGCAPGEGYVQCEASSAPVRCDPLGGLRSGRHFILSSLRSLMFALPVLASEAASCDIGAQTIVPASSCPLPRNLALE